MWDVAVQREQRSLSIPHGYHHPQRSTSRFCSLSTGMDRFASGTHTNAHTLDSTALGIVHYERELRCCEPTSPFTSRPRKSVRKAAKGNLRKTIFSFHLQAYVYRPLPRSTFTQIESISCPSLCLCSHSCRPGIPGAGVLFHDHPTFASAVSTMFHFNLLDLAPECVLRPLG